MPQKKKKGPENKSSTLEQIQLAAIGMEAEFAVVMDGVQVRPEDIFGSPRRIIREKMMHRKGRSYHLPTGGAVYFDTGVIEVATPVIEIERGCAARAGRSLWEAILFVRQELDAWEQAHDTDVQLAGFSTHYNISFDLPPTEQGTSRTVDQLAYLLAHIIPVPVMLLAANRRSTGIGVRPRGDRIEITADFTPDAPSMKNLESYADLGGRIAVDDHRHRRGRVRAHRDLEREVGRRPREGQHEHRDQELLGLGIAEEAQHGVFFHQLVDSRSQLVFVGAALGLDGEGDRRLGELHSGILNGS